jgi:hypothetical protein
VRDRVQPGAAESVRRLLGGAERVPEQDRRLSDRDRRLAEANGIAPDGLAIGEPEDRQPVGGLDHELVARHGCARRERRTGARAVVPRVDEALAGVIDDELRGPEDVPRPR